MNFTDDSSYLISGADDNLVSVWSLVRYCGQRFLKLKCFYRVCTSLGKAKIRGGLIDYYMLPKLRFCFIESYIKNILPEKLKCKKNKTKLNLV